MHFLVVLLLLLVSAPTWGQTDTPTETPTPTVTPTPTRFIHVYFDPSSQNVITGGAIAGIVKVDTNGLTTCVGGVFFQFNNTLVTFVNGSNNTATWGSSPLFNHEPSFSDVSDIITLSVGSSSVSGNGVLVSNTYFLGANVGTTPLTLLHDGQHDTDFTDCVLFQPLPILYTDGEFVVVGTATPLPTGTPTPTATPTVTTTGSPLPNVRHCR